VHILAWLFVAAMCGLLIWPWKTVQVILCGIMLIFVMAWSSWSGNPALFAAFMAVLCGVGLLVSYFGEQQDKRHGRFAGGAGRSPYPAWLRDQVLKH
jgi:hypothetical protein